MDMYNQLAETTEWQEVELLNCARLGSFNKVKIKLLQPYLFKNSSGFVVLHEETLPTAKGYWSLDGREYTVSLQEKGLKHITLALVRTEDCGLGAAKARACMFYFGYRMGGYKV